MNSDRTTIGVTPSNEVILEDLVERGLFADQIEAAKFAMSIAVKANIKIEETRGTETKWNVGSIDKDGSIRELITALYDDINTPYKSLEFLINAGLELIGKHIAKNQEIDILKLIE